MSDLKFQVGDPVWSKMKGYCAWPSRIATPNESPLRNSQAEKSKTPKTWYLVYFFGSNNFAWMSEDTIKPYEEFKDKNKNGAKNAQFKQGIKQVEEYIANDGRTALLAAAAAAAKNNSDKSISPSPGDSLSNDASNDGLPSIDDEIATMKKATSKKSKNSQDSHNDSPSHTSPSVQRDYSRVPFKSRKTTPKSGDEASTDMTSPTKRLKTTDDDFGTSSLTSPTNSTNYAAPKPPTSKSGARNVIFRSTNLTEMVTETPQISMNYVTPKSKNIKPSNLKFGFIGLGLMGQRLLKNLLNSGHTVTIWNRSTEKCKDFLLAGASDAKTPGDVVSAADVVFSCVANPLASKEVVFGSFGVLSEMTSDKAYVEMSSIDTETSNDISEAILSRGGRYLEAPMISSGKSVAEEGELTIVAAGDRSLYEDCSSCFQAIAKKTFYLGPTIGSAVRMHLVTSMLYGAIIASTSECCGLIERAGLQIKEFKEILQLSMMNCPLLEMTVQKIISVDKSPHMPLVHLQKDLRLALNMSEEFDQSCPIAAVANEVFKHSKRYAMGDCDASIVHTTYRY